MKWEELIQRIALDDEDREAYGRYQAWVQQQQFKTDRNLYIENWYDPDIVNEFCYYPVSSWDKLIQWAKEYYGEEEGYSYEERMIRASMILVGIDPEVARFVGNPEESNMIYSGRYLLEQHEIWARNMGANASNFSDTQFRFNSFTNTISLRNPALAFRPSTNPVQQVASPIQAPVQETFVDDESEWLPMDDEEDFAEEYDEEGSTMLFIEDDDAMTCSIEDMVSGRVTYQELIDDQLRREDTGLRPKESSYDRIQREMMAHEEQLRKDADDLASMHGGDPEDWYNKMQGI